MPCGALFFHFFRNVPPVTIVKQTNLKAKKRGGLEIVVFSRSKNAHFLGIFGFALRVLGVDIIIGGGGTPPHENMVFLGFFHVFGGFGPPPGGGTPPSEGGVPPLR